MNLLPFHRKSMRVQDLKQQTAIRLAQEQQRRNADDATYESSGQQPWNNAYHSHHNASAHYQSQNEYEYDSQYSGYHHQNQVGAPYRQGNEYQRGNRDGWEDGANFPAENYAPDRIAEPSNDLVSPSTTPPSTPRNRRNNKSKPSNRETKREPKNVGRNGMASPTVRTAPSFFVEDVQTNKIKQGTPGKSQHKLTKKKDQRRNTTNADIFKPNQSPMGRHHNSKQFPRQLNASPHNVGQSYSSQYYHMHQSQMNSPRRNQQRYTPSNSSKLPHGLTVQELKEMTKARLAAEPFETQAHEAQSDQPSGGNQSYQPDVNTQRFSPSAVPSSYHADPPRQDPRYRHHQLERQMINSSESVSSELVLRQRLNSAETSASAPATTNYSSKGDHVMVRNFSHHSLSEQYQYGSQDMQYQQQGSKNEKHVYAPNDVSLQSFNSIDFGQTASHYNGTLSPTNLHSKDSRHNQDVYDTASINSINSGLGSEYLGSEPAYPTGVGGPQNYAVFNDEDSRYAFGRSCSYPSGPNLGYAIENAGDTSAFSPCHNRNRCRAATASPHVLSHLLEDRPVMDGINGNFSISSLEMAIQSPKSNPTVEANTKTQGYDSSNGSNSSSPVASRFGTCNFIPDGRWYDIFGRPSSSTTVPTIEPSSESFCANEEEPVLPLSFGVSNCATSSGVNPTGSELPNSVAESVLGTILDNAQKNSNTNNTSVDGADGMIGISGVFRNVDPHPSPNQINKTVPISRNGTFDSGIIGKGRFPTRVAGVNSWGNEYQGMDVSNVCLTDETEYLAGSVSMLRLEDDLNSLLNIAGDERAIQKKRHHCLPSLVSKIDPEVDVYTSQPSLVANSSSSVSASATGEASQTFVRNDHTFSNIDPSVCSNVSRSASTEPLQNILSSNTPQSAASPQRKSNSWASDFRRRNSPSS
uniref:Uncharacterized protein n=1 Tax=Eucampia antarctica TaxID=49252 RepID=A0A7S2RH99_9STRA|mmetsp:Transcript_22211/g.21356  ORF Transcript_22211/g.21356 Transcript_22211/m.21356 type:complete len:921 (+) Transcript_22211:130-2892(+)